MEKLDHKEATQSNTISKAAHDICVFDTTIG